MNGERIRGSTRLERYLLAGVNPGGNTTDSILTYSEKEKGYSLSIPLERKQ